MLETHRKQRDDAVRAALSKAGIGEAFHIRKLNSVTNGDSVREWLVGNGIAEIKEGKGLTFTGNCYDLFILTARGVLLAGVNTKVMSLYALMRDIEENGFYVYDTIEALFIWKFYPSNGTGLTTYQQNTMEAFIEERLDDKRATFVHGHGNMNKSWSAEFCIRLHQWNRPAVQK